MKSRTRILESTATSIQCIPRGKKGDKLRSHRMQQCNSTKGKYIAAIGQWRLKASAAVGPGVTEERGNVKRGRVSVDQLYLFGIYQLLTHHAAQVCQSLNTIRAHCITVSYSWVRHKQPVCSIGQALRFGCTSLIVETPTTTTQRTPGFAHHLNVLSHCRSLAWCIRVIAVVYTAYDASYVCKVERG